MKPHLDDGIIFSLTSRPTTYARGRAFFEQGRVSSLRYDEPARSLTAAVRGTEVFDVLVRFTEEGAYDGCRCDCEDFAVAEGPCKHIVAALIASVEQKAARASHRFGPGSELIDALDGLGEEDTKTEVQLEVALSLDSSTASPLRPALEFRIGHDRLYSIRNLAEFCESLQSGNATEIGRGFHFDPKRHRFSKADQRIVVLLEELWDSESFRSRTGLVPGSTVRTSGHGLFKGRRAYLPPQIFRRTLELLEGYRFLLRLPEKDIEQSTVLLSEMPIELHVDRMGDGLRLSIAGGPIPVLLTEDGRYCLRGESVFRLAGAQERILPPLLRALSKAPGGIVFAPEEDAKVVSRVIPRLRLTGRVQVEADIADNLYSAGLSPRIYFDRAGEGIAATVEFWYEDVCINPFADPASTPPPAPAVSSKERILIRDFDTERSLISFFDRGDFKFRDGTAVLTDEDRLYSFLRDDLPTLAEQAELFLSEDFRRLRIRDARAFRTGLRYEEGKNLLSFTFQHAEITDQELGAILSALQKQRKYFRLRDGTFIDLEDGLLQTVSKTMDELGLDGDGLRRGAVEIPTYRALFLDSQLQRLEQGRVDRNQAFKRLVLNLREPQDMDYPVPEEVAGVLRDYQRTGFRWMRTLSEFGMGGILADDMGLGKTLQTLAYLLSIRLPDDPPALVVAPSSLLFNWQEEAHRFAPSLRTLVVSGPPRQRQELMQEIARTDLVITSYPLIRRDIDVYAEIPFSVCFLDEAQHIKNASSVNARAVKQIRAPRRFALTGTPIENSLDELWSIFDFVMPGYLHSYSRFQVLYEKPISVDGNAEALARLSSLIAPFLLRRLKKDVLKELPPKFDSRMSTEMTDDQKKIYVAQLTLAKREVAEELAMNGAERGRIRILSILTRLRQICCHPASFMPEYTGDSGKMQLLAEIVEDALESGHRLLVFSQFTSILAIIRTWADAQGIPYAYLDGSTPVGERSDLVRRFNAGAGSIFLISLKAGGTGLNLTGADMVVHFDPWWNPAVEDQATDRAYRIGQKQSVQVIKLISKGTIEEKVIEMQQRKKGLIDAILRPGETFLSRLTEDEILDLFEIRDTVAKKDASAISP